MKIYTTLNIGEFHTIHCEDFLVEEQIGTDEKLIAVLDGCTMGKESVFASILLSKIVRSIAKKKFYQEFVAHSSVEGSNKLKDVLKILVEQTKLIKNQLTLEVTELLSTLIVGIVNTKNKQAEFISIGDGLICVDGRFTEYEQNDKPDYLGYHLDEDFDHWFKCLDQRLSVPSFSDLSICTDGIFSFKNLENKSHQKNETEILKFMLVDTEGAEFDNFLDRKIRAIKENWNHLITDDLALAQEISSNSESWIAGRPFHGIEQ